MSQDISNLSLLTQMIVWRKRLICDVKCYLMDVTVSKEIKIRILPEVKLWIVIVSKLSKMRYTS